MALNLATFIPPILYIAIIVGSMATFSSLYRKRKAQAAASMEPWFPASLSRDIYLTLLHLPDTPNPPKIPDSVLRAALLRRATDVIQKAITIRQSKGPLQTLLQRGSVGDDTWNQFLQAEQEIDAEIKEVAEDAMALSTQNAQWAQFIFQSAAEMITNDRLRQKLEEQKLKSEEWAEWWGKKTEKVRSEFLASEGVDVAEKHGVSVNPAMVLTSTLPAKTGNVSDEDGVLVEADAAASVASPMSPNLGKSPKGTPTGGTPTGTPSGSVRKKKGRK
ncbi:translocation protein S66 [Orbilia ellipsospora]|uniref:Translocation protein S66 n=1 Tax=Orbilia ellipsospora TaxID=2528407 RepID=A0AAV9WWK8_9PEZI